jgi:hypothetical protein
MGRERGECSVDQECPMRDWLLLLAPIALVAFFMLNPDQFTAFMAWASRLVG